jgi:hypothetical protein
MQYVTEAAAPIVRGILKKQHAGVVLALAAIALLCVYLGWHRVFADKVREAFAPKKGRGDPTGGVSGIEDLDLGAPAGGAGAAVALLRDRVNAGSPDCPPRFDLRGTHLAKFISCYDGDTCDVALLIEAKDGRYKLARFRARTMGFNAEEIKQPVAEPDRERKKDLAVQSRDLLWNLVSGLRPTGSTAHTRIVAVDCHGFDKYGRLLVEIFPTRPDPSGSGRLVPDRTVSINKTMLAILGPEYAMDSHGSMVAPPGKAAA